MHASSWGITIAEGGEPAIIMKNLREKGHFINRNRLPPDAGLKKGREKEFAIYLKDFLRGSGHRTEIEGASQAITEISLRSRKVRSKISLTGKKEKVQEYLPFSLQLPTTGGSQDKESGY